MACWTLNLTQETKARQETTLEKLEKALQGGTATVKIAPSGAIAFDTKRAGISLTDDGLMDVCVYRRLLSKNSAGLRKAVMRAEALAGRKVSETAIGAGIHSHDGGKTWGKGH
jgi:hypothetical protein